MAAVRAPRSITTLYYAGNVAVKRTTASTPIGAIRHAIKHLMYDDYSARVCEITVSETGFLLATIKRTRVGYTIDLHNS